MTDRTERSSRDGRGAPEEETVETGEPGTGPPASRPDDADAAAGAVPQLIPTRTGDPVIPAPDAGGTESGARGTAGDETSVMSLVDHLSELRRRLAISIAAVLVFGAVGFILAPHIIQLLLEPLPNNRVVFLTLSGGFLLYMRIAIFVGILLGLPVILYQAWAFVSPGLTPEERRATLPWIPMSILFFLLGTVVAYVTLPYAVTFLLSFQIEGSLEALTSSEAYFGFVTFIFVIFGAVMQFPIVLVFLSRIGIVNIELLRQSRRYVLFGVVVFAVVITPGGDPVSPLVLSGTMYGLYELSILLLRRRERQAAKLAGANG
jgi:sec-independent protein translocase protein TatC